MATITTTATAAEALFAAQKQTTLRLKKSTVAERIARIVKLRGVITDHFDLILKALHDDYKKPTEEAKLFLNSIFGEIDVVVAFLESWMKPQVVTMPEALGGEAASSKIIFEPKGVCLFIMPWNYPFLFTFRPLNVWLLETPGFLPFPFVIIELLLEIWMYCKEIYTSR